MINQWLGIQQNASAHGAQIDMMLELLHWFVIVLFIPWTAYFIYCLFRFRKSRNPKADYQGVKGHTYKYTEYTVIIADAVFLLALAIPLWAQRVNQFPTTNDVVKVRVIGEEYNWNFHYPGPDGKMGKVNAKFVTKDNPIGRDLDDPNGKDDIVLQAQLHLPVNKPVILQISSKDVIHSFKLLHFRVCQDAIPGQSIPLWFTPIKTSAQIREGMISSYPCKDGEVPKNYVAMQDYPAANVKKLDDLSDETVKQLAKAGVAAVRAAPSYPTEIICAQLCGLGHANMHGYVTVETQEEFDKWIAEQAKNSAAASQGFE